MRRFEYRQPRWTIDFNLEFVVEGHCFSGHCIDCSDAGVRASIQGEVVIGSIGSLKIRHPARLITLPAVVARAEPGCVGLSLLLRTPEERGLAKQFQALLGAPSLVS